VAVEASFDWLGKITGKVYLKRRLREMLC